MLDVQPFRGIRYTAAAGEPASVIAPPYDVIGEEERRRFLAANPYNIVAVDIAAGGYDEAASRWSRWLEEGIVARDHRPAFYAYRQIYPAPSGGARTRWGLTAAVRLAEYGEGVVFPHERTLPKAKEDRLALMRATRAQLSPVFGMHFGAAAPLDHVLAGACTHEPAADLTDGDGVRHTLWVLDDPGLVRTVQKALEPARVIIADGHHRYETALAFRNEQRAKTQGSWPENAAWNYVMMVLVDMDSEGLTVFPTHRLLRGVEGLTAERLLERWRPVFDLEPVDAGAAAGPEAVARTLEGALAAAGDEPAFAVYTADGRAFLVRLSDHRTWAEAAADRPAPWRALDVSVLHGLALPLLGLDDEDQSSGEFLSYTRSAEEAVAAVQTGARQAAVLVRPTPGAAVRDVALAGESLPQKSTYYWPKLLTGLVMSDLDSPVGL